MTDYETVIAQAVEGLDQNTSRARCALYERARTAQVTQLRAIHPPLSETAIAKARLSLESAIRKVEADAAGKSETGPRESQSDIALPRAVNSDPSEQTRLRNSPLPFAKSETPQPTRAGRLPRWSISKRSEGFSDVLNAMHDVCPTAKATQEERGRSEWPTSSQPCPSVNGETSSSSSDTESNAGALGTAYYETPQTPGHQLSDELAKYQEQTNPAQLLPQAMTVERQKPLTPLRHRKLVKSIVAQ